MDKTQTEQEALATMVEAINVADRWFLAGNESVEGVAQEWIDAGFDSETAYPWWLARCFDAGAAARCRNGGLTPEDLSKPSDHPGMTVGYAVCNRDMSVDEALRGAR